MIIVPILVIIPIVYFTTRKKHKYVVDETGISFKKRMVEFDKIKMLRIRKQGNKFGIGIVSRIRLNSLIFPCDNLEEKEKLKELILAKNKTIIVKESKLDLRWVLQLNTIITLVLFLFSFTWKTKLEPFKFKHNAYSQTNYSTQNYDFLIEDVQFDDMISPENHYLLTSKGKITLKQYANPELSVLEYFAYPLNPANMEKERPLFPFIDFYNSNYEGFLIRLIKRNGLIQYAPSLFNSEYFEAVLLNNNGIKELILRRNKERDILYIEFSTEFSDEDILQVLESVKFIN